MRNKHLRALTESAILIAVATVLSELGISMPMGGKLTICSMLPIIAIGFRHGVGAGMLGSVTYSVLQLLLGMDNVMYGETPLQVFVIIALDYIVPYVLLGLSGFFAPKQTEGEDIKPMYGALAKGIGLTFTLRFLCHFVTGAMIWDMLWPNEYGLGPWIYSLFYNGIYMLPEIIITTFVAILICKYNNKIFARQ